MEPPPRSWNLSTKFRIKLVVSYDGTDFCGWAPQDGQRTVHGILTDAVRQVSGEDCEITGASRTDSGAHARGQTCHFDTDNPMPVKNWIRALNDRLPSDLAVQNASKVSSAFHSRFWADRRWYRYQISVGVPDPFRDRFAYFWPGRSLDVRRMEEAAFLLEGQHDFYAFSQLIPPDVNTHRELFSVRVREIGHLVAIDVVGTAFLRGMMRRISGSLLEIGRGAREPQSLLRLLNHRAKEERPWPAVLPAHGLCLMKVIYGRHPQDSRLRKRFETTEDNHEQDAYG
jgi:tRNA pseudouridine38-40 synthase